MNEIVGRDDELAAVDRFLERPLPAALLIRGEAGIGKTALWRRALRLAEERSFRVLAAAPAENEVQLPYSVLGDLFAGFEESLDGLPPPQRRALASALLLEDPAGLTLDRRAVALAALGLLGLLASDGPLLVAVDDIQWVDADSRATIEFVLRRVGDRPIGALLAMRNDSAEPDVPLELDRAPFRLDAIDVEGLSLGATSALVRRRFGGSFRRPALVRIHETAGGNPLFALELARAVPPDSGDEVRLPDSLRHAVETRIATLPPSTRDALLVAAALSNPTTRELAAAGGADTDARLRDAIDARIVEVVGERIRFAHPLFRSAVYGLAERATLRRLHGRLAQLDLPIEERARQLALATEGVDPATAQILEDGARTAALRGASAIAADLAMQAVEHSDPADEAAIRRRRYLAADEYAAAGDVVRSHEVAAQIAGTGDPGPVRARALLRLAKHPSDLRESKRLAEQALEEAGDDDALRCDVLIFLAKATLVLGERESSERLLAEAIALAAAVGDDARSGHAEIFKAFMDWAGGRAFDRAVIDQAQRVDEALLDRRSALEDRAAYIRAVLLWNLGELAEARNAWLELERIAEETGDETARAEILNSLGRIAYATGDWNRGAQYDDEAVALAEEVGLDHALATNLGERTWHASMRGDEEAMRVDAARCAELAGRIRDPFLSSRVHLAFALTSLARGEYAEAAREAEEGFRIVDETGSFAGLGPRLLEVGAEAAIGVGEPSEAERLTARLEQLAESGIGSTRAEALRCRGLVLAAKGDLERGTAALVAAAERLRRLELPFEQARALLSLGEVERRGRHRRAARENLEEALAIFESLGSRNWAERARGEIARIGGRASSGNELTAAERRIATLVAAGKTNKEVAAALFVTVHTVEAALTRIYGKLGIRSRTELASRLADTNKV